jgi:hypothetical protein
MAVDHRALGAPDQGTDDGVRLARIADLQALRHRDEPLAERVENRLFDQDAGVGHANLALMEEDAECGRAHGVIDIGVAENNQRALAAHFEGEPLQRLRCLDGEMATGLRRASESDHPHSRIGENGRANFRRKPGDDAEEAGRQTRLVEHLGDLEPRHGRKFRGLQNEAIARGQRQNHLLHGEKEWSVERRDAGDHAKWLAHGKAKLPRRRQRHRFARRSPHLRGGSPQEIEAKADLEAGLAGDRSGLLNQDVHNFVGFGRQYVGGAEEYRFARGHWRRRPGLISAVSGGDREFGFRGPGLLDLGEQFPRRGISALYGFVARGADPFSANVKIVIWYSVNQFEGG